MTNISLFEKAKKTAAGNLRSTSEGPAFASGGNQFYSMWVRDFCFSVPGLLAGGFEAEVRNHLRLIYENRNSRHLLPRGIDTVPPQLRVIIGTLFRFMPSPLRYWDKAKLKPEYLGEHKTPAFDSNLLYLRALCDLQDFKKDSFFLSLQNTKDILSWYDSAWKDGFLDQPAYSDWHDSAKRLGHLLHTQVLYIEVVKRLRLQFPGEVFHPELETFEKKTFDTFFDLNVGLFKERLGHRITRPQYALDSHMMILNCSLVFPWMNKPLLYKTLKAHPLWAQNLIPGLPIFPPYREGAVSWTTRIVGLRHYHDGFLWGWLIAESVRTAHLQRDFLEAERITRYFSESLSDEPFLSEIYEITDQKLKPVKGFLYRSESPFTWSAGKWLQALQS
jgi:hypothetical protein